MIPQKHEKASALYQQAPIKTTHLLDALGTAKQLGVDVTKLTPEQIQKLSNALDLRAQSSETPTIRPHKRVKSGYALTGITGLQGILGPQGVCGSIGLQGRAGVMLPSSSYGRPIEVQDSDDDLEIPLASARRL